MTTSQMQLLNEIAAGHDGPPIPVAKRAYFQERLRGRVFDFIVSKFAEQQGKGLNKAKLGRRIGKAPEIINRILGAPSNLTIDTISDLMLGISAEELDLSSSPLLHRPPVNYSHTDHLAATAEQMTQPSTASASATMFSSRPSNAGESAKGMLGRAEQAESNKSALCE